MFDSIFETIWHRTKQVTWRLDSMLRTMFKVEQSAEETSQRRGFKEWEQVEVNSIFLLLRNNLKEVFPCCNQWLKYQPGSMVALLFKGGV